MLFSDHLDAAILKPDYTAAEARVEAERCAPFHPKTLCLRPWDVPELSAVCRDEGMGVCVVLGFPHGTGLAASKVDEARRYVDLGVDEVDMVCSIGRARAGEWTVLRDEIAAVVEVTHTADVLLKVIFETCFLDEKTIRQLVNVCVEAKADFVKTSTGFNGEGAQDDQVRWMLDAAAGRIRVKPSGGIRTRERAEQLIAMGADRLGVGSGSVPALCGQESPLVGESY